MRIAHTSLYSLASIFDLEDVSIGTVSRDVSCELFIGCLSGVKKGTDLKTV